METRHWENVSYYVRVVTEDGRRLTERHFDRRTEAFRYADQASGDGLRREVVRSPHARRTT